MPCPESGTENTDHAENRAQCEKPIKIDAEHEAQNTSESEDRSQQRITNLNIQSEKVANEKPVVSQGLNIAIILGTLIFPIIGIAMGFTYMRKSHPDAQEVGKRWLILGIVMIIINILVITLN